MPTSRRIVDSGGEDFYPTPTWATEALLANETFVGSIWEPACGDGAISKVLEAHRLAITMSTDLFDRGYGDIRDMNFLEAKLMFADNIITNPPYNLAEEFVHRGLEKVTLKLALLLRLSFLESARRFDSIFSIKPPSRVWVFSERITFYPNGLQTAGSGTLAYGWFVWDKVQRDHNPNCELKWIAPGFKEKGDRISLPTETLDLSF